MSARKPVTAEEGLAELERIRAKNKADLEDVKAKAKGELAELKAANDATEKELTEGNGVAETLAASAATIPEDEAIFDVDLDFDFLQQDPSRFEPYFERAKVDYTPDKLAYRWESNDIRRKDRWMNLGWRPVAGGRIRRGDAILVQMPKALNDKLKAQLDERNKLRENSPMARFEAQVRQAGGEVITGNKSLRDGLD